MSARIPFAVLRKNFPSRTVVTGAQLYESIGHPDKATNGNWVNTCALRVSLALVRSGMPIAPGFLTIRGGPLAGRRIESRQKALSELLRKRWGEPERYKSGPEARLALAGRRGVVSFYRLHGGTDTQGHIDLLGPDSYGDAMCADDCYWSSIEVWFWPLK